MARRLAFVGEEYEVFFIPPEASLENLGDHAGQSCQPLASKFRLFLKRKIV